MTSSYQPEDYYVDNENDEYLTRVVVDTCARTFHMYSNEGNMNSVPCDSVDEFMDVLDMVRGVVDDDLVVYNEPLVK
tara:strand:+ start:325 stop:555 length:231 start_codon:yes stop_codon:yes gene_type:complete